AMIEIQPMVKIYFRIFRDTVSPPIVRSTIEVKNLINELYSYIETRNGMILSSLSNGIDELSKKFKYLKSYLDNFEEQGIKYEQYLNLRKEVIPDYENLKKKFEYFEKNSPQLEKELRETIEEIEKRELNKIITLDLFQK
ncbi:MAG: hypothetical protein ABII74_07315, partial [Elusimicrobiota bacterium]